MEHSDEKMCRRRVEVCKVKVLGKVVEGLGFINKVFEREDRFWSWQIVLLEVAIKAGAWRSKVRDAG